MSHANESIEYLQTMSSKGDADQLIPTTHLLTVLAEIERLNARIITQAELLTIYRKQLNQAQDAINAIM